MVEKVLIKDRFSRFDTIPAVTDRHPASDPATLP